MVDQNAREIFVRNLHKYMDEKKITQADIASKMNLTASTVSDWYKGKNYPRVDAMQRLAALLDVSMRELTTEIEEEYILSELERCLVDAYRSADPAIQSAVRKLLDLPDEKNTEQTAI